MSRRKGNDSLTDENVVDYRHINVTRLNIPPAGLAARGQIAREKQIKFAYNPHLSPVLRFDASGKPDGITDLIALAGKRKLEPSELKLLHEALGNHEPWLEWAGKKEQQWCVADPVALHLHERISTQAILRVAKRQDIQRSLFAEPEQEYREAVQFYKHPMDWTNRMILGDSLAVMASLARREALTGKVQMIYMDPPYGIKYASNFQPEVGHRDVKDRDQDLTREPEMVKAYRDTWTMGVHSYLSYLRDRLLLCKELLADTGCIFVQISDENLHRVRSLLDEVFGAQNFVRIIEFVKTTGKGSEYLDTTTDFIIWYAKDITNLKYRQLMTKRSAYTSEKMFTMIEDKTGFCRSLTRSEKETWDIDEKWQPFIPQGLYNDSGSEKSRFPIDFEGAQWVPPVGYFWRTNPDGMKRLARANRLFGLGKTLRRKQYQDDFGFISVKALWTDTMPSGFASESSLYTVQTSTKVIERCMLLCTDPGDLVLDPTCGSGTTAYVAEQWGRRWITIDVSRVALAVSRQRLLTAKYEYYKLHPTSAEDVKRNPGGPWLTDPEGQIQGSCTFAYKTVAHVMLKNIVQNQALDPIYDKWEPVLFQKLDELNHALKQSVTKEIRFKLLAKYEDKQKREGKKSLTDADARRWQLPEKEWQEWEVPYDTDPDWPKPLKETLTEYRKSWRQKMDEINACITARADQEELVDQPFIEKGQVRVSGPFTMEGIIPAEESIDNGEQEESPIGGALEPMETFSDGEGNVQTEAQNSEAYLDRMIRLLREDGVLFPNNKMIKFITLETLSDGSALHASGIWADDKNERRVGVMFGPQYGPLIAPMVEDGIRIAARRGFDDLVFAAFSFDGAAQATIQEDPDPKLRIHMAQIRPDVNMGDLLKTTVSSQLFTVSGSPRTRVEQTKDKQYLIHMEGVDIYDPVTNSVKSAGAEKVAAWFLDSDYDGRCFCICQAFFPDRSAWEKLGKALGGTLDENVLTALSGTTSLPFPAGQHKRVAVKVIDPRGNEVLRVHQLEEDYA
jgi:adenine-specific DNA-methyltransferase